MGPDFKMCPISPKFIRYVAIFLVLVGQTLSIPLVSVIILIFMVLRVSVGILAKLFRPDLLAMVSNADNLMAFKDQEKNPINIVVVYIIDGQLPASRIRELYEKRVFSLLNEKSEFVYAKLKLYYKKFLGYPFWVEETPFHLNFHIRTYDPSQNELQLPEICTQRDLQRFLGPFTHLGWFKARSPWEMLVHQKYVLDEEAGEFKTLCMFRINHVLGDGLSLAELARVYTASPFTIPDFKLHAKPELGRWEKFANVLRVPVDVAADTYEALTSQKFRHFPHPGNENMRFLYAVSSPIPVKLIKDIKNRHDVGFNSVVVSVIVGAICRAIAEGGREVPDHLGGSFVVPVRNHPGGMANHATIVNAKYPCTNEPAGKRLKRMHTRLTALGRRTTPMISFKLIPLAQNIPIALKSWLLKPFANHFYSFGMSTFPAFTSTDSIDGMEWSDGFGSFSGFQGIDFTIWVGGYSNRLRFNFVVERTYFASEKIVDSLANFVDEEIQELAEMTHR